MQWSPYSFDEEIIYDRKRTNLPSSIANFTLLIVQYYGYVEKLQKAWHYTRETYFSIKFCFFKNMQ